MRRWILVLITVFPFAVQAQVDLTKLDRDMAGTRSKVLVLGTVHLRYMPKNFKPAALDSVLDHLAKFKPDIITIETESGEECDMASRHPAKYGLNYCASTAAARSATGLDVPAALAEVNRTFKRWPTQPTPAQRRHLAALFLAANDLASAYVQWLLLAETERVAGDSLNTTLVQMLEEVGTNNNESYQIAARLAARLGLQRVYAVDNHTGDNIDVADTKALVKSLEAAWATAADQERENTKQVEHLQQAADLLPLYRFINDPKNLQVAAETNVQTTMRAKSPEGYPQMWVAGWEIRNLRMVANIRETFRERPGARALTIVGATHKPWLDSWLGQLQGLDIVDVGEVLK